MLPGGAEKTYTFSSLPSRLRRATVSLRLGHGVGLTAHRAVIQHHAAASLPWSPREALALCKPAGAARTLASPFGGGVRAQRRTERVSKEDPLSRLRRQLSQRESQGTSANRCCLKKTAGHFFTIHYYLLPQFAPPLRYDETRDSSEITTFPLISRLRRQLPPEGKPFGCGGTGRLIVYAS